MTQPIYEVVTSFDEQKVIKRTNENGTLSFIPMDESNSDYQRYLRWLEDPEAEENGTIS
jgi:hypothetical protein